MRDFDVLFLLMESFRMVQRQAAALLLTWNPSRHVAVLDVVVQCHFFAVRLVTKSTGLDKSLLCNCESYCAQFNKLHNINLRARIHGWFRPLTTHSKLTLRAG